LAVNSKYAGTTRPAEWASIARRVFGIGGQEAFVDVEACIRDQLGISVQRTALPSLAGLLLLRSPGLDGTVLVEERDSHERQRFTLAHELKHILVDVSSGLLQPHEGMLVHPDTAETLGYGMGAAAGGIEATADQFAGEFLMATEPFQNRVGKVALSISGIARVAEQFHVSVTAAVNKWVTCAHGRCVLVEVRGGRLYRFVASPAFAAQAISEKWIDVGATISTKTRVGRRAAGELELELDPACPTPVAVAEWIRRSTYKGTVLEDVLDIPQNGRLYALVWYAEDFPAP